MEQMIRRMDRVEARLDSGDNRHYEWKDLVMARLAEQDQKIAGLTAFRDNQVAKHSSTPAWLFGSISAAVSIAALLFNLYLAGIRP